MAQVSYGTITITDITDITEINIYYAISDQSEGITPESQRLVPNPDATGDDDAYILVSIWQTECPMTTAELPYLWQYEVYVCGTEDNLQTTIIPPRIIGIFSQSGKDGTDGIDGIGVISTRIIYYLSTDGSIPAQPINYIVTEDTSVIEGKKYYQLIDNEYIEIINIAEGTNPHSAGYYEISLNISNNDVTNQWTEIVPSYVLGGIYYQCVETVFNNSTIPFYGPAIPNYELTNSQQTLDTLEKKGRYIFYKPSFTIAGGLSGEPNPNNPSTYGYNTNITDGMFAIRYNQYNLTSIQENGITFFSSPNIVNNTTIQGTELLTIDKIQGISMYASPNENGIRGNQLLQLGPSNLIFYNPNVSNQKGMELNSTDLIFYNPNNGEEAIKLNEDGLSFIAHVNDISKTIATYGSNGIVLGDQNGYHITINDSRVGFYKDNENEEGNKPVAYISADQLYIAKTVVLNEMLVGSRDDRGEWAWRYDNPDDNGDRSIYLKWIGEID